NIHFNAATTQIVPFLSLGLGVDDMFLLVHNYKEIVGIVNHNEIGFLMKETGLSVLLTSINNILAFLAGSVLPIPALRSFCLQTAILLFFNMIAIMTMYPAMMAMDLRRRQRGYIDLCCCVHAPEDEEEVKPPTVHKKKTFSKTATLGQEAPPPYEDLEASADSNSTTSDTNSLSSFSLQGFLVNYYIPFITNVSAKIGIIVFCTVLLGAGIMGLSQIVLGLELSDVLPKGTAPAAFLEAREKYFSFYPMFAVVKGPDVDFPAMQHKIEEYRQELGQSRFVIKVNGQPSEKYWMSMMKTWLNSLQVHYDKAMIAGKIDNVTGAVVKGSKLDDEAAMARRLVCSFGENYNCTGRVGVVRLVDSSDTINNEGFYNYLTAWYNVDNMMYYVSQASFVPTPPAWQMSDEEVVVPPARPFGYSQIPFYLTDLVDTAATVEAIKDIRMRCEKFADAGLPNFPSGLPFTFWEQYLHLTNNLLVAILLITGAVFLVISLLLLNPWTSSIVVLIVLIMVVELAGFMGWAGLKLNPVSAVTIITAVGIGVEFTVHVCLSFLTTLGTRNERVARTLEHMFVPVVHGGLSTLLGIVMLAFSQFEFIVRYFFLVLSMLILLGLINGLALLPVLLSLIGPNCEVTATDGSNRLPPPSPKKRPSKNDPNENSTMTATVTTKVEMTMSNVNGQQNKTFDRNDSLSTINEDQEENNQPTILTTIVSTKVELTPQQQPTALRRLATPPETRRDSSTPQTRWSLPPTPSSMSSLT
uniref:SSD domain-containing protein n=1 Tax=Plectus sambesii TaxID=2011161 RepID=A0A914XVY2_9BILA